MSTITRKPKANKPVVASAGSASISSLSQIIDTRCHTSNVRFMKKPMRYTLIVAAVLGVAVGCLYGYYRYKFPYGSVHRCSKTLATLLNSYAQDHEGHFPQADDVRQLGMEKVLDAEGTHLDLVVGKAGDLAEAERFYKKNGYLLKDHSSWHEMQRIFGPFFVYLRERIWASNWAGVW